MLTLVGLGLWDETDISLKGIEEVKRADVVYAELYTGLWNGSVERLEELSGKDVVILKRRDVEERSGRIIDEARSKRVCFLIQGDPLAATTHPDLLTQSAKAGVETRVIHASSIFTAVAECGLQIYKFGKTVTIPLPEKTGGVLPESVYGAIKGNLSLGLHTLLLLDIDVENNKNLLAEEALQILEKLDTENLLRGRKIVVMSLLGSGKSRIVYGKIEELLKDGYGLPAVLIIPGNLHFAEEEFLELFKYVRA
ncbi:MAG: diphthine synthase [Candidatus Aenigmarchaeota archaeon]|nr:diphthine synthase [Candidatus Aenigmarchaeota archaeon]